MADDDSEQPTQVISRPPSPPGATATLEPHEPLIDDGGPGGGIPPIPPTGYGGDGSGDGDGGDGEGGDDRRVAILGAIVGILVVVVLFLLLKPGSDDEPTVTATPAAVATPAATPAATDTPTPTEKAQETPAPATTPAATTPADGSVGGGAPVDGGDANVPTLDDQSVTKMKVSQGDTVTFKVKNDGDATREVHVHGYDKMYDVEPGETRTISFKATLTGIYDIEFEDTATQIGELTVEP